MGILDDIARSFSTGGFSPQAFAGPGYEAVWSQVKPWLARISTNGVLRWIPRAAAQMPCQVPEYENGFPTGPCSHVALEGCLNCKKPICINHAFINDQGEAICFLCVASIANIAAQSKERPHQRQAPPPPPDAKAEAQAKAWWARGVLNVQEGVPWDSIRKQHRSLSAQFHPDKSNGDEQRFKDIQKAFDILKTLYGEN